MPWVGRDLKDHLPLVQGTASQCVLSSPVCPECSFPPVPPPMLSWDRPSLAACSQCSVPGAPHPGPGPVLAQILPLAVGKSQGEKWEDQNLKITKWFGLEGTSKGDPIQFSAMGRDSSHYPRLLQAPSSLAWNTSRDGAATVSLDNLCQWFNTLIVKIFLLNLTISSKMPSTALSHGKFPQALKVSLLTAMSLGLALGLAACSSASFFPKLRPFWDHGDMGTAPCVACTTQQQFRIPQPAPGKLRVGTAANWDKLETFGQDAGAVFAVLGLRANLEPLSHIEAEPVTPGSLQWEHGETREHQQGGSSLQPCLAVSISRRNLYPWRG
ncbi:uncharacterized protein LOC121364012 [Pyrgilauda ruficollis]|uniref:uncharacterized protein LOC121364012 n=1 Tax=Pyrgilauda ruficollis TaxID=221976 RepID=UPI001B867C80|nr:uncharacterized protein LOC121364012 [Pyrgilauda ruficollis]XP_041342810.1 uncharacterized protein LOC121364012 [Pyrgilauda ruficollis]XP_041342811.1 uncharacterized protein LOC121364012 [Pyrgilauda ruficollis]XP_041342812.1 uncharacterized protein LOC121364012 [Pyrgilauda ruficollis]XP_041342813.1 uncharacterized protein LOC121364012 [Pyrgilauda ruficollis]XP_041342815.1 uncharacterized protein LOC121364012 [Pyrgilauda ruficollis]XP_041342816.1 uncharacterized protein LOC121364012 [Pyrgil